MVVLLHYFLGRGIVVLPCGPVDKWVGSASRATFMSVRNPPIFGTLYGNSTQSYPINVYENHSEKDKLRLHLPLLRSFVMHLGIGPIAQTWKWYEARSSTMDCCVGYGIGWQRTSCKRETAGHTSRYLLCLNALTDAALWAYFHCIKRWSVLRGMQNVLRFHTRFRAFSSNIFVVFVDVCTGNRIVSTLQACFSWLAFQQHFQCNVLWQLERGSESHQKVVIWLISRISRNFTHLEDEARFISENSSCAQ